MELVDGISGNAVGVAECCGKHLCVRSHRIAVGRFQLRLRGLLVVEFVLLSACAVPVGEHRQAAPVLRVAHLDQLEFHGPSRPLTATGAQGTFGR